MNDFGEPVTVVYTRLDSPSPTRITEVGSSWVVEPGDPGSTAVRVVVVRGSGDIRDLWISPTTEPAEGGVHFAGADARAFINLLQGLPFISVGPTDAEPSEWLEKFETFVVTDSAGLQAVYAESPALLRDLISADTGASDVIALAHRREQVARFRRLLTDDAFFDTEATSHGGKEVVWQHLLEANPWMLGVSLGSQLMTAWDDTRLEQVVAGASIAGVGKRPDAVLRTAGRIRGMALVEIKHHRTPLLGAEYRSDVWGASSALAGAVSQAQVTAELASKQIGERLQEKATDGSDIPGEFTYLFRPRSYVITGSLDQFVGDAGGHHSGKIRSFELFRRNLQMPEIITFDELLARAEWLAGVPEI